MEAEENEQRRKKQPGSSMGTGNNHAEEAAAYTGIGVRKLRGMTDEPTCDYVMWVGNRRMIKRRKLDEYLENAYSV